MIKSVITLLLFSLVINPAMAQTPPRMFDLKLSQEDLAEIGKLAGKAPFDDVVGLMSRIQAQLNAIGSTEKTAAEKAAADAKAQERAKIEAELRAKIEKEKVPPSPQSNSGIMP